MGDKQYRKSSTKRRSTPKKSSKRATSAGRRKRKSSGKSSTKAWSNVEDVDRLSPEDEEWSPAVKSDDMYESKKSKSKEEPRTEAFFRWHLRIGRPCYGDCPRNRSNDPFCLCRLQSTKLPSHGNTAEPNKDFPAGLRNLGNTCYMNSYLQTLFHTLPVRRVLFEWRFPPAERRQQGKRYDLVVALQHLFTRLQSGQQQVVDPRQFAITAGLNAAVQQDAQEFSILFLDWVDQVLAERAGEEKLQSLYTGKLRSIITCRECKTESSSESDFHDFGLKTEDIADIMTSITHFFAPEKIDDYKCRTCMQQQIADKKIQLTKLPRFLNLHLLRYAYDRVKKVQQKLTHAVQFPQLLDLGQFLTTEQIREWGVDGCRFDLMAILIHQGGTQGGHYFARIRVSTKEQWFTFNDANVTPYKHEEHEVDARDAYLLVYEKRCDVEKKPKRPEIPPNLQPVKGVDESLRTQMGALTAFGKAQLFLSRLRVKRDNEVAWLPVDWLANVASAVHTKECDRLIRAPAMTGNLCAHGQLNGIGGLKAVDAWQADVIFETLGILPKPKLYDSESFCEKCNSFLNDRSKSDEADDGVDDEDDD